MYDSRTLRSTNKLSERGTPADTTVAKIRLRPNDETRLTVNRTYTERRHENTEQRLINDRRLSSDGNVDRIYLVIFVQLQQSEFPNIRRRLSNRRERNRNRFARKRISCFVPSQLGGSFIFIKKQTGRYFPDARRRLKAVRTRAVGKRRGRAPHAYGIANRDFRSN